ncbi:amino acid adenylation domain-containing protein [Streptomyces sp. NPDC059917]|uniref:amino acid adenylation domain-containing protein n=1 Tax=Streptomyces sp. NPDC059917 TaxID=3347002 RepID=UPI00364D46E4
MSTTTHSTGPDLLRTINSLPAKRRRALIALLREQGVDLTALGRIDDVPLLPREDDGPAQLSFAQQRLWFLAQLDGSSAAYNIPVATRLSGPLDRPALRRALAELVRRHEALRTRFADRDGVPHQLIGDGGDFAVAEADLADPAELARICAAEAATPFDLEHDRLIRVRLLCEAEREHVLLITMHHAVSDGWSVGVLIRDLSALYEAFAAGLPSPLAPLPVQYADYALWQRQWLQGAEQTRQTAYWKEQLAGVDPRLTLPADRERPAVKTYRGARAGFLLPPDLLARLREVAARHEATLYMTLLAAYSVVLNRYTGQSDIAVGTVVAGRNRIEVEGLIGFFANTLVMRADLSDDPAFPELLAQVKRTALAAYDHQDVPFEAVADALQLERSLSHSPVFQTMLVLQEAQTERTARLGELLVSAIEFDLGVTKFDLTLDLRETPDGLAGTVEYNTDLFDPDTIRRFTGHFGELLGSLTADPGARLSGLSLLDEAEREQVVRGWNDTDRPFSADRCLHELFEARAARHPGRTALVDADRTWTYAELNAWANRVADALRRSGVGPDTLVGLSAERSAEMVAGIYGILKAGGAYMPIEPSYPAARIEDLVESSGVRVVLTQPHLDPAPLHGAADLFTLDRDGAVRDRSGRAAEDLSEQDLPAAALGLGPGNLAYVIHTSGSTGRPKGVMIEHRAAVNRIEWMQNEYRLDQDDVVLQKTPYSFDVSVWEFFWPLLFGARLAVAAPGGHKDPAYLVSAVREFGVTTLHFVPSMLRSVVAEPDWSACTSVRQVFCSGEALPPELCARHYDRHPAPLHNLYGPTEAAVDVSHWTVPAGPAPRLVPIGRPIQNIRLYVLNEALRPQGVGCVGQLYIAGTGLARGYLHQPELTRERFVPDPFATDPDARMYLTGDLARWLPDGTLEYLGRADDQVKLRGFRIELGEIEHRLTEHPAVRACAVIVREDQPGSPRLVAYPVLDDALAPAADEAALRAELVRHLEATLPEYMVPGAFVVLDELPVTAHGKLDRRALPVPDIEAFAQREYTAPATPTERLLAGLWAELLGFDGDRIGSGDNFFALGGHSLLITVLVARLAEHGLRASVRAVFGATTLAELATALDAAGPAEAYEVPPNRIPTGCERITPELLPLVELTQEQIDAVVATVPGGAADVQDVYPLVATQEGILFHRLLDPDNDPYLVSTLYVAEDEAACAAFTRALQAVVDRHDVMRTAVVTDGLPAPVQVVHRRATLPVRRLLLDPERDAEQQALALLERPDNLEIDRAPLLRLTVAEDPGSGRRYLLLSAHHLIEDATSLRLTLNELALHMADRADLLAPPAPYRDFVAHTRNRQDDADAEGHFRAMLGDVTEPTTPFGLTDVHGDTSRVRRLRRALPDALTREIRTQAQRLRIAPASLFHAAWARVVAATSGRDDVVFGTILSGRLQGVPGVERMLGNFINTLPLRTRLAERTVRELIADVDTGLKDLIDHEQTPLGLAQRCSALAGDAPLFSAVANFRHFEAGHGEAAEALTDGRGVRFLSAADGINYPLVVSLDDFGTELSLDVQADEQVACEAVADYLESALAGITAALADGDGARTAALDVPVLPAAELHRLLTEGGGPTAPVTDVPLGELVQRQAARTPAALAVSAPGGDELTYAQLNERANRLARVLIARGVGPDTYAGVSLPRGSLAIVAFLAVLKSGAAYLPIDPEYPQDRIDFILGDTRPAVVLTDRATAPALPGAPLLVLDDPATLALLADAAADDPRPQERTGPLTPETPAYVVYTSGSTGRPKGVVLPARVLTNLLAWSRSVFPAEPGSRVAQFAAVSFDMSEYELLNALLHGKTLCVPAADVRVDPAELARWLDHERITEFFAPNVVIAAVYEAATAQGLELTALRHVLQAGEALQLTAQVRQFHADRPWLRLHNQYGPSETHVATAATLPEDVGAWPAAAPLGHPVANTRAHVLDDRRRPVPVGVAAELYLAGTCLALGYLGRPDLTAERFVEDPFGAPGERMYRTGDLARRMPDGTLEYLGRADDQVKVRGFRIEPGEIVNALHAHPAVHSAVVVPRASGETTTLVAYARPTPRWLDEAAREQDAAHLERWRRTFDERYAASATADPAPPAADGARGALARAVGDLRPKRLLEIGCGAGDLLRHYAEECEAVHVVDVSAPALDAVRRLAERRGWTHVSLVHGDALSVTDPSNGPLAGARFDTIVLDSVVRYFPNRPYLEETLARLLPLLEEGGRILIGGVRNLDLFPARLCAAELADATAGTTAGALRARVQDRRRAESELLLSPSWFASLTERFPELGAVDLLLRRGDGDGEEPAHHYDALLTKGATATAPDPGHPWLEADGPAALRALLDGGASALPERFGVSGLTNPRVADDVRLHEDLARWPATREVPPPPHGAGLSARAAEGVRELEDVLRYAESLGHRVAATWSQDRPEGLDLVFGRGELPRVRARSPYRAAQQASSPQLGLLGPAMARMLKEHLAGSLPEYMVPSAFVILEELPLTSNGKVDKRALPAPGEDDVAKGEYVEPRTDAERTLCRIVGELLGVGRVGLRDSFFDLGGHSLLATRLTLRVKQETGAELPLKLVFTGATLEQLAAALERSATDRSAAGEGGSAPARTAPPLVPVDGATAVGARAPLALQQRDLWFLNRPGHLAEAHDNVQLAFRIDGPLDRGAFTSAVRSLVERHPILRTGYTEHEGVWTQRVHAAAGFTVPVLAAGDEEEAETWAAAERLRPFAPDAPAALRAHLIALSENAHVAVLTRPWGIFDGWSVNLVLAELMDSYRQFIGGREPRRAAPALSYADFAHWQQSAVDAAELERQREYWRGRLAGLPAATALRTDYPRGPVKTYQGSSVPVRVPAGTADGLRRLGRERGATLYMSLLSAYAVLLGGCTDERELAVGTAVANRPAPELEQVVGYFTNTLVMRLDVDPQRSFTELLADAGEATADAHTHLDLPFSDLVRSLIAEPDPAHSPLFQVMFNLLPAPAGEPAAAQDGSGTEPGGLAVRYLPARPGTTKFDLNLVLQDAGGALEGYLEYSTDLFARGTAERLARGYERLLGAIAASPDAALVRLREAAARS